MTSRLVRPATLAAVVRVAIVAVAAAALSVAIAVAAPAAAFALPSGCSQVGGTVTCTYTAIGEHQFAVPAGVTSVTTTAVGGQGGSDFGLGKPGGLGAVATGSLGVTPGQVIFAEVGILGGAAGQLIPGFTDSGAGGGESDVRTCPTSGNQPCPAGSTLASRLVVAGGGGGTGDFGGAAGNAGTTANGGDGTIGTDGRNDGGPGGGATASAPGAGGAGCDGGGNGSPGAAAGGAGGAAGPANGADGVSGGGGGAGWFGGGAGGGCSNANDDGGSGGGGTSHAAVSVTGPSFSQASSGQAPSVTLVYTVFAVTTTSLAGGSVGESYSAPLAAVNGTTPYTWSLASGSLPDGLSLDMTTGTISGTPQAAGTSTFTVQATDSSSPANVATQNLSIAIAKTGTTTQLLAAPPSGATAGDPITLTADVAPFAGGGPAAGGTVTFTANGTAVCGPVPVSGGVAQCLTTLTPGTYTLEADYSGDSNYTGGSGSITNYVVGKAAAGLSLSASPSSGATADSPVTLTANVAAQGTLPLPGGTVDFTVDGTTPSGCGSVMLTSSQATCTVGVLPTGSYTLAVSYPGDGDYLGDSASITNYAVSRATPTVALSASPSSGATVASPVSLTATVTDANGGPAPSGTVDFTINGTGVPGCGNVTVTSGSAACSAGTLPGGTYTFGTSYSGDTNFLTGSDSISNYQVAQAAPGVSLSATPSSGATVADPVSLSVTVVRVAGGPAPTGDVTFLVNGTAPAGCSNVSLSAGTASCAVGTLPADTYTFEASYTGDASYLIGSDSIADYVVSKLTSAVAVSSSSVSSSVAAPVWGQPVSFVATITAPGGPATSGTVQWSVGGAPVGAPVSVGPDGAAQLGPVTDLAVGSDQVTAAYSGTSQIAPATGEDDIVVGKAATSTRLTVTAASLVATVAAVPPGAGTPTGFVTFVVNGSTLGNAPLSPSGTATLPNPSPGVRTVSAAYGGDASFTGSSASNATTNPAITAVVTSKHPKTKYGWYRSPVTITFTCVTGSAPLTGPCPGPVTLSRSGAAQSATATVHGVDGGIATAVVSPINIDRAPPALRVSGAANRATYNAPGPVRVACEASDRLSGLAGPCVLKVRRGPSGITWRATAIDKAGNVSTVKGAAGLIDYYVAGVRKVGGFYQVKIGTFCTLEAFVNAAKAPRLVFAAPLGVQPHPVGPAMIKVGDGLWSIRVHLTSQLRQFRFWTLGVLTGGHVHTVKIEVRS